MAQPGRPVVFQDRARCHRAPCVQLASGSKDKARALYPLLQQGAQNREEEVLRSDTQNSDIGCYSPLATLKLLSQIFAPWKKHMNAARSKRVLIVEISTGGHHPFYVRSLLESDLAKSAEMIVASQRGMFEHPAIVTCSVPFQRHYIEPKPELELQPKIASAANAFRMSWSIGSVYRKVFFELSRSAPIDFVIVPYVDNSLLGLAARNAAFRGTPWLAITMRTMFHYASMGVIAPKQRFAAIRRILAYRILRQKSLSALLTIDPTLAEFAARESNPLLRKIHYIPDPATHHSALPSKAEARLRLSIPAGARVVLLYGAITVRKGALLLVEAAAAAECSHEIHVILAGRYFGPEKFLTSEAVRLLEAQGRIHILNGFVDEEHERLLLAAADCIWGGYIDFYGASGVMALAGRHAVPVLASEYGLVGYLTKKYALGVIFDPRSKSSIVTALNRLAAEPEFFIRAGKNSVSVYQSHNPNELQRLVTELAKQSWTRPTNRVF
jgi:glycosyltransferase involved in cell wall biosynthesis